MSEQLTNLFEYDANGRIVPVDLLSVGSGGTPGGEDTQIQFNDDGAFAGASGITTDGKSLTITSDNTSAGLIDFPTDDSSRQITFADGNDSSIHYQSGELDITSVAAINLGTSLATGIYLQDDGVSKTIVGMGDSAFSAVPSAVLALSSTTQGFLPTRMTSVQRDAIATPAEGLTIYNTTSGTVDYYNGATWLTIPATSGGIITDWASYTPTFSADFDTPTGIHMFYRRVGNDVEIRGSFVTGASPTSGVVSFSIPAGLSINNSKLPPGSLAKAGSFVIMNPTPVNFYGSSQGGELFADGSSTTAAFFSYRTDAGVYSKMVGTNFFGGVAVAVEFSVPATGW